MAISSLRYAEGWKKKVKALIPRHWKYTIVADLIDATLRHTSLLDGGDEPPAFIEFGGGGFVPIGDKLVDLMITRAGLKNGMAVIDVGSGIGRSAVAISKRLTAVRYLGFDIVRYGVTWCRKRFARAPGFAFLHADIFNSFYNPRGKESALMFRFPAQDASADFVFATSVFTHMQRRDVEHYLMESARCMKPQATAYFTCFVMDEESRARIGQGATLFRFQNAAEGVFLESTEEPDLAVAFERSDFQAMAERAGLEVCGFYPGSWRGLDYPDYQDAYVLTNRGRTGTP